MTDDTLAYLRRIDTKLDSVARDIAELKQDRALFNQYRLTNDQRLVNITGELVQLSNRFDRMDQRLGAHRAPAATGGDLTGGANPTPNHATLGRRGPITAPWGRRPAGRSIPRRGRAGRRFALTVRSYSPCYTGRRWRSDRTRFTVRWSSGTPRRSSVVRRGVVGFLCGLRDRPLAAQPLHVGRWRHYAHAETRVRFKLIWVKWPRRRSQYGWASAATGPACRSLRDHQFGLRCNPRPPHRHA